MKRIVLLFSMFLVLTSVVGQTPLEVQIQASQTSNDLIQIHLVSNQGGSLMSMQGTIEFDPSLCTYQSTATGSAVAISAATTGQIAPGQIGFSWLVDDGNPVEFFAGDTLATFLFSPIVSSAANAPFSFTSNGLTIEFIGIAFNLFDVNESSTSLSWDSDDNTSNSSSFVFHGFQLGGDLVRIDLQPNEELELLSCQGTVSWETQGTVTSLGSNTLINLDFQDATTSETALGWSWFSPNVLPVSTSPEETLLSIWIEFDEPTDSMLFTLNSALIEIEFIGADFTTLSISPLEELVVFNADTISNNCTNCTPGCTYNAACNFNPLADDDDGSCAFPELGYDCNGNCTFDIDQDGICDFEETYGCSYPSASNFNPLATEDNGICFFELESACPTDVDDDGVTGVSDILNVLSNFGYICQ